MNGLSSNHHRRRLRGIVNHLSPVVLRLRGGINHSELLVVAVVRLLRLRGVLLLLLLGVPTTRSELQASAPAPVVAVAVEYPRLVDGAVRINRS